MKSIVVFIFMSFLFGSCMSSKKTVQQGANLMETSIYTAILDFSNNCSLFKKDSVFHVKFEDTVYYVTLDYEKRKHVLDTIYENKIAVGISGEADNKIWYRSDAIIGSKGKLPSRYMIVKGKLFYWNDDDYPLTEETLSAFKKYDALSEVIDVNNPIIPEFSIDDSKKGADYYFCKNDLSKYKRVVTNIGFGYYKPPKLKCK